MKIKSFFTCAFIVASISAAAQNTNSFYDILNAFVVNSPEIEILRQSNSAEIELARQESRLSSPEVEVEHVWGRHGVGNKFDVGVSQSFDWPGIYRARAKSISSRTESSFLQEQAAVLDKVVQVARIMVDVIYQKKHIEMAQMIYNHMLELEKVAKESYNNGNISKLEYKRIEIERVQAAIELRETERQMDQILTELTDATGIDNCKKLMQNVNEIPKLAVRNEEYYENALSSYDPYLSYLKSTIKAVEAEGSALRMATSAPSFTLGYVFQREQGETFNGFNIAMSLPFYGRSHATKAAKATVISAQLEARAEEIKRLTALRNERLIALSLSKELNDYSLIFDDGNYSDLLKLAIEGGQIDNMHYLQELNYYLQVSKQYVELEHQYALAMVALNRFELFSEVGRNS